MRAALAAVDWRSVLSGLSAYTTRDVIDWHVERRPYPWSSEGMTLAVCAVAAGESVTAASVVAAGGTADVGRWCWATAPMVLRGTDLAAPEVLVPRFHGPLWIEPTFDRTLPLTDLAGEWADRNGTLVVRRAELRRFSHGRTRFDAELTVWPGGEKRRATVVEIGATPEEAQTWAHELAHLLAPADLRHDEDLAEALGRDLLAANPQTLAEAQPLIDQYATAARARRPAVVPLDPAAAPELWTTDTGDLPAPGIESLIEFLALPLASLEDARP